MGGVMSGTRWSKKRTVESCHALDTADLKRLKFLAPGSEVSGTLRWVRKTWTGDRRSEVGVTVAAGDTAGRCRLVYQFAEAKEDVAYTIRLVTTVCHLGGVRWWFVCPLARGDRVCGRQARKLYLVGRYFGCRHCHGLTYASTQQSDPRVYAALRGGLNAVYERFDDAGRLSVPELGLALKVFALAEKRLDRTRGRGFSRRSADDAFREVVGEVDPRFALDPDRRMASISNRPPRLAGTLGKGSAENP
jgi:hypothetical protein